MGGDTILLRKKDKYYSLGGLLRKSKEVNFDTEGTVAYINQQDTVLSGYVNDGFVALSGDAMSGFLSLYADPVTNLHAATKQYVDIQVATVSGLAGGDYVNISGDDMLGYLTLHADPALSGHATTKQYVDTQISAISGLAGGDYVNISGDTMIGSLSVTNGVFSLKSHTGYTGSDYIETTAAGQTTNTIPLNLHSLSIEEGYAYWFESTVIGKKISPGISRLRLEMNKGCINRDIGSSAILVSLVDNSLTRSLDAENYNVILAVSGNNLLTVVSGGNSETVNWVSMLKYQKIG